MFAIKFNIKFNLLTIFCAFVVYAHAQILDNACPDRLKSDIGFLASDKLKGRGSGSKEEKKAAKYIAARFQKLGLKPVEKDYLLPFSFKTPKNPHSTATEGTPTRTAYNVAAKLDNGAKLTVVLGAHYDHLGLGHDHNSLEANPEGKIHNGADDNASGTAGILELARYFSQNNIQEPFNIIFVCFSAEELGLIGSKKFCELPVIQPDNINFMFNLDMVGRLNEHTRSLMIYGVGTSPHWIPLIQNISNTFSIKTDSSGIGPSDHTSFYLKKIPVLFFFTGQHSDYHKPSDDVEKVNFSGEKDVLEFIIQIIELGTKQYPDKFPYLETRAPESSGVRFKVTLGIMPDYSYDGNGLRVDGVTKDKPAAKAGIQAGDIIIALGENTVTNVETYMKALATFQAGNKTTVVVLRGDKKLTLPVEF